MTKSEKYITNYVLDSLEKHVRKELEKQDKRANKRMKQGRDCSAADGQCTALDRVLEMLPEIQAEVTAAFSRLDTEEEQFPESMIGAFMNFSRAYKLLKEGKKIKVNMNFVYPSIPTLTFTSRDGVSSDQFEIDCIPKNEFETYMAEKPVPMLDTVAVTSYRNGEAKKIRYVYANPQMNRLFAVLEDGTTEDFKWSILDLCSFEGEYIEQDVIRVEFLGFTDLFSVNAIKVDEDSTPEQVHQAVIDYVKYNPKYKGYNIRVSSPFSPLLPYDMYIDKEETKDA